MGLRGLAMASVLTAVLLGCGSDPSPEDFPHTVQLIGSSFHPEVLEVPEGSTVVWFFEGFGAPHNVRGEGFRSPDRHRGTFHHTFEDPGVYDYKCTLHGERMGGRITVHPSP
jgi:plastocyanin